MKSTYFETTNSDLIYTMPCTALHKISCIYPAHISEIDLFPNMAVQQRQRVDAVGCLTLLWG